MIGATIDIKYSRNNISKTAKRRLVKNKVAARRLFRHQINNNDRNGDFDGHVSPTFTAYHIN
jgi:hypothetical protein